MKKINNEQYNKMKSELKAYSNFGEYDIIKETEKAILANVDHYVIKKRGMASIKKWIPKSYLYFYEFQNGIKHYFINHDFMTYA